MLQVVRPGYFLRKPENKRRRSGRQKEGPVKQRSEDFVLRHCGKQIHDGILLIRGGRWWRE